MTALSWLEIVNRDRVGTIACRETGALAARVTEVAEWPEVSHPTLPAFCRRVGHRVAEALPPVAQGQHGASRACASTG